MIGVLALVGLIATAFGLFTQQALGTTTPFVAVHLVVGGAALISATGLGLLRIGRARQPALFAPALRALAGGAVTIAVALLLYFGTVRADVRFDWTFEGTFELSEATRVVLDALPAPLTLTLYFDVGDPRIRNTRLLLEEMARGHDVTVRVRAIEQYPDDENRFGIGSSNSVVVDLGGRWTLVDRPSEGALYQALSSLSRDPSRILYIAVGAGEGDLERSDDTGYSGLRAALESEGYEVRPLPLAMATDIPPDAEAVVSIAPQRTLPTSALEALERYIESGGRLVAFVEPSARTDTDRGIERVLTDFGIRPIEGFVVDPASGPIAGDPPGRNPIVSAYSKHPVTRGLESNRMTFFRGARALALHKAEPNDRLRAVVHTSGDAWMDDGPAAGAASTALPVRPEGVRADYQALVATAEIDRGGGMARIVVFGDADLASNRYLRALYNLDLVLNAVHWATEQESVIAIRPKTGGRHLVQFPVPLQASLQALYGVGLLVPELLLIAGGLVWLRQREA